MIADRSVRGGRARRIAIAVVAVATSGAGAAVPAAAQMFSTPTLQNAFSNPGVTVAANFGNGEHANAYGAAVAWAPATARFQLSGGAALLDPVTAGVSSTGTWGARVMLPIPRVGTPVWGVAAFAGIGGARRAGVTEVRIPIGVSAGYRRAIRGGRGISGYVAPFYTAASARDSDDTRRTHGVFRVSFGVDGALLPALGLTVGYETGATAKRGEPGPTGGVFGIGFSYALGRRH